MAIQYKLHNTTRTPKALPSSTHTAVHTRKQRLPINACTCLETLSAGATPLANRALVHLRHLNH